MPYGQGRWFPPSSFPIYYEYHSQVEPTERGAGWEGRRGLFYRSEGVKARGAKKGGAN